MSDTKDKETEKSKNKQSVLRLIESRSNDDLGESKGSSLDNSKGSSLDELKSKSKPSTTSKKTSKKKNKDIKDPLGDSIAAIPKPPGKKGKGNEPAMDLAVVEEARKMIEARKAEATSDLAMLRLQTDSLSECVQMAAELYKNIPLPDNAYQLSALTTAYNSSLSQAEKMKDPEVIIEDLEDIIKEMFTSLLKSLAMEIKKTQTEMQRLYPEQRTAIEDLMDRMLSAIAPESQTLYDELYVKMCKALGVKPKKD